MIYTFNHVVKRMHHVIVRMFYLPLAERVNKRGANLCHTHAEYENHDNLIGFLGATITLSGFPNFPSLP